MLIKYCRFYVIITVGKDLVTLSFFSYSFNVDAIKSLFITSSLKIIIQLGFDTVKICFASKSEMFWILK